MSPFDGRWHSENRSHQPGKRAGSHLARPSARRAGFATRVAPPVRGRLLGVILAFCPGPRGRKRQSNPKVLSHISGFTAHECGRQGHAWWLPPPRGRSPGRDGSKRVSGPTARKSRPRGWGPRGPLNSAGVGSPRPGDRWGRLLDRSRGPSANPRAANSSTTRGPQGLASDLDRRRCRTANASHRWVGMSLYILHAEIA